jgi:hypothetical protein
MMREPLDMSGQQITIARAPKSLMCGPKVEDQLVYGVGLNKKLDWSWKGRPLWWEE